MTKFYVYRIVKHNGRKEYKRTKCSDFWAGNKAVCWQFTKKGAEGIVAACEAYNYCGYYTYGMEPVISQ